MVLRLISLLLAGILPYASASLILRPVNNFEVVDATDPGTRVLGYDVTSESSIPSSFNNNILNIGPAHEIGMTGIHFTSEVFPFTSMVIATLGGDPFFVFVLESQESDEDLSIDKLSIVVGGALTGGPLAETVAWMTNEAILINTESPSHLTLSPKSQGADLAVYVPVSAFDGLGLTGSSQFRFEVTHSLVANGTEEEWIFSDEGVVRDGCDGSNGGAGCAENPLTSPGPGDPIGTPTPEPATVLLLGAGLTLVWALRRKR